MQSHFKNTWLSMIRFEHFLPSLPTTRTTMSDIEDDDYKPQLSADILELLQQHMREQAEQQERFEKLRQLAEEKFDAINEEVDEKITMEYFTEDWQMSQFWYDDETAGAIASEMFDQTSESDVVCCLSSPTAYVTARADERAKGRKSNMFLFEFDTRFDVYGRQFIHYDYNKPTDFRLASELEGKVDMIVVDPPFLSEECLEKTFDTVKFLLKPDGKLLLCTGYVMAKLAITRMPGLQVTNFHPGHRNGLANDFRGYANYDSKRWIKQ